MTFGLCSSLKMNTGHYFWAKTDPIFPSFSFFCFHYSIFSILAIHKSKHLPLPQHILHDRPPDIAQALALLEGEQGDDGVDEFLALDKFGRFHAVAKDLVEKVGQHRLAEGGHIRTLGDSLHEVATHLLILNVGG